MALIKHKILVIENDLIQRDIIELALQNLDCDVIHLNNGHKALDWLMDNDADIVIVDLFLPQMSGLEVLSFIKSRGKLFKTTVIVVSAMGFPEVVEQAKEAGAYEFLVKPINGTLLIERVTNALSRKRYKK